MVENTRAGVNGNNECDQINPMVSRMTSDFQKKPIRVLLVDDEESFLSPIAKRMNKRGYSPQLAFSGEQCLKILEEHPKDVVVLDVKMPGMNGLETLKRIRTEHPDTEVILLTGQATTQDGVEGIKSGAFDYLSKPIELEHLLGKIGQAYDKILRLEEKRREEAFREQLEQQMIATERLASLGTLATGVAHEINNPLAIIKEAAGWMSLILKRPEMGNCASTKDMTLALSKIETGVDRARRITHKLLGFVKKNESALTESNIDELIEESIQLVQREAANQSTEIHFRAANKSPTVILSDPFQLRQVLLNLLTNAIHATEKGGKIHIILSALNDKVVISIEDTGIGIPKENLKKIFEPFFSTKSPGKGTGLGLFVTHNIVDKLGGEIAVESHVGKGTRFDITLPRRFELREDARKETGSDWLARIKERFEP